MTKTTGVYWCAAGVLYVLACALLWPTLEYGIVGLDDASLLNEFSEAPFSSVWGSDHFGHLRPSKNLLFWLLGRSVEEVAVFRGVLLAVALASGMMLQRLGTRLMGSRWWGLLAAACWLLNPTTVSTVAWLAASNYVLALFFVLGYLQLAGRDPLDVPWADKLSMVAAHVALLLAALSHELALLAPLLLLVSRSKVVSFPASSRSSSFLVLAALAPVGITAALLVLGRSADVAYRSASHPKALLLLSSARYAFSNLHLWFWQRGCFGVLLADEPGEGRWRSAIAWLVLLAIVGLSVWLWRRDPASRFGLVWVGVFLLPVINLVPLGNTPVAVQYLYLPGVGLALLLSRAAQRLFDRTASSARALPAVFVVAFVAAWLPESQSSVSAWADTTTLYQRTLQNHPTNVEARANLVSAYLEHDQLAEADALLVESLRIAPDDPALVGNRFELLWRTERWVEALSFLDGHEDLRGDEYTYRRGRLLEALGRPQEALPLYATVSEQAGDPELRFAAGYQHATILVNAGRTPEAKRVIERMLKEFPEDPRLQLTYRIMTEGDGEAE
ncbi:MAG: hypothetical protein RLZZ450_6320 [Pseudomonadota bacterium]